MDLEPEQAKQGGFSLSKPTAERAKTALRMRYEAESQIIQKRIGTLDEVRQKLGLSQRKVCQLLLVDPSAWNRWMREGVQAPPHIYRALEWYLSLQDKFPGGEHALHTIPSRLTELHLQQQDLKKQFESLTQARSSQEPLTKKSGSVLSWALIFFIVAQSAVILCLLRALSYK